MLTNPGRCKVDGSRSRPLYLSLHPSSVIVTLLEETTSIRTLNSELVPQRFYNFSHTTMDSYQMFNWPDGDAILRATHPTDSRDFRVHKFFLSAFPVFKDMFKHSQPSSVSPNIDIIDVVDPPRVLERTLRFIYPCTWPIINDLAILL